jgi:hypothetical protein
MWILFRMTLHEWLKSAAHPATMRRACTTSLVVGTLLIAINHGHAIIAGQITHERIFQMLLTVVVPYMVSTASSVSTRDELGQTSRFPSPPAIGRLYGERELVAIGEPEELPWG